MTVDVNVSSQEQSDGTVKELVVVTSALVEGDPCLADAAELGQCILDAIEAAQAERGGV